MFSLTVYLLDNPLSDLLEDSMSSFLHLQASRFVSRGIAILFLVLIARTTAK